MNRSRQSYIYAALAIFFWSTIPTVFKIGLGEWPILPMLTLASLASSIALLIIVLLQKKLHLIMESTRRDLLNSAILGLINPALYYLLLLRAYQLLPAQVAQPLNMIWPIILVFLSVPLLGQKIGIRSFVALFISFAGVYVISSQGKLFDPGESDIRGVFFATGSSVFWALYFILNMRDRRDEAIKLFMNFLFGSVYLIIIMFITGTRVVSPGLTGIASSVYIGFFEMGVTFFFWLKALQLATTTDRVSNLVYLAPFLSLLFIHFIIHEPVYYTTPAGLLLIISGILIQTLKKKNVM
jgi:drug/metabolite transporter (DMT)-like permease